MGLRRPISAPNFQSSPISTIRRLTTLGLLTPTPIKQRAHQPQQPLSNQMTRQRSRSLSKAKLVPMCNRLKLMTISSVKRRLNSSSLVSSIDLVSGVCHSIYIYIYTLAYCHLIQLYIHIGHQFQHSSFLASSETQFICF